MKEHLEFVGVQKELSPMEDNIKVILSKLLGFLGFIAFYPYKLRRSVRKQAIKETDKSLL